MERLPINGTAEQLAANDVYGIFSTLFRDSYYHADIGEVSDSRLEQITNLFGARWNDNPVMTIAKVPKPQFIAGTEQLIPAHNECAYTVRPPRLLALYCVENTAQDGAFFAVSPAHLINKIGQEYLPSLRNARYTCQMSNDTEAFETTLMRNTPAGEQIIFTSIAAMDGKSPFKLISPSDAYSESLVPKLTQVLNDPGNRSRHMWRKGDLIVVDNLRLMHGREAFGGGDRILRHIRLS